ncbi:hypothetical protein LGM35_21320 [Burkholderia cenocepacia]|uniref:hypothetical protein n=1 Tax=Burkholderia cenocepacia TaxID=95486 RepID=UPI001CF40561|nr:hypothetical protein [Burkholderia cenocepacia]MCA7925038.1 hypothetical protein [Burkholderia cenocepacia]
MHRFYFSIPRFIQSRETNEAIAESACRNNLDPENRLRITAFDIGRRAATPARSLALARPDIGHANDLKIRNSLINNGHSHRREYCPRAELQQSS